MTTGGPLTASRTSAYLRLRRGTITFLLRLDELSGVGRLSSMIPSAGGRGLVLGTAVIRGRALPVVDFLPLLAGAEPAGEPSAFAASRRGRSICVAADEILSIERPSPGLVSPVEGDGAYRAICVAAGEAWPVLDLDSLAAAALGPVTP